MNKAVMFSSASDEWATPQAFFDALDAEFGFAVDIAATADNAKCVGYFGVNGLHEDALTANFARALRSVEDGTGRRAFWCNPPYSRGLQKQFIAKAAAERLNGHTVVMLLPARTDTKAFHTHIYDASTWQARPGVEIRFIPGRLKFGGAKDSAPFPSMVVIFRGSPA
jgi:phage N-6-adenine-methyltransferase